MLTEESSSPVKKGRVAKYSLTSEQGKLVKEDEVNRKLWDEAMATIGQGAQVTHRGGIFIKHLREKSKKS